MQLAPSFRYGLAHRGAGSMLTPMELRAGIPALQETTYLNYGSHGPTPKYVVDAATDFVRRHEYDAPVSNDPCETAFGDLDETRDVVASFVGAQPDESRTRESHSRRVRPPESTRSSARSTPSSIRSRTIGNDPRHRPSERRRYVSFDESISRLTR